MSFCSLATVIVLPLNNTKPIRICGLGVIRQAKCTSSHLETRNGCLRLILCTQFCEQELTYQHDRLRSRYVLSICLPWSALQVSQLLLELFSHWRELVTGAKWLRSHISMLRGIVENDLEMEKVYFYLPQVNCDFLNIFFSILSRSPISRQRLFTSIYKFGRL